MEQDKKIMSLHPASHDHAKVVIDADAEVCTNCLHIYVDKDTDTRGACRRFPPTVLAIPQANALGQVSMTLQSLSPPVPLDYWCGEFEPAIDTPIE